MFTPFGALKRALWCETHAFHIFYKVNIYYKSVA